jgi:hypothetical protein
VYFSFNGGVYLYIVKQQKTCPFATDGFLVIGERERDACSETGFTLKNIINTNPIN